MTEDDLFSTSARAAQLRPGVLGQFITGLMTDNERAQFYGLPAGCRMRENAKIYSAAKLECGENVWIGEDAKLDASGGLSIGANTSIGSGTYVWSHSSVLGNLLDENASGSELISRNRTTIGRGCHLPGPSVVMPGVTIGDYVVCLPMSVIAKDVPSYTLVGGNPAKVIRVIDEEFIERMLATLPLSDEQKSGYLAQFAERPK